MRRNGLGSLMSIAALSVGMTAPATDPFDDLPPKPKPPKKQAPPQTIIRFTPPLAKGSIAKGNRRGGAHQHSREVERRLRQAARKAGQ